MITRFCEIQMDNATVTPEPATEPATEPQNDRPSTTHRRRPPFVLDDRVTVKMSPEFAADLGQFILRNNPSNKAMLAFAHQCCNVLESPDENADDDEES